jgi:hypothetical protein
VGLFSHQNELNMNQKTPCLQMLSWKLHVRTSVSPRKSPFIVFITPSILNKNGGDRLRKTSISSIFEEEILENCRFWEVQTSGFGLCIIYPNYLSCFKVVPEPGQRNSFSKRLFVPQNTAYIAWPLLRRKYAYLYKNRRWQTAHIDLWQLQCTLVREISEILKKL